MSDNGQDFKIFQDSVVNSSWTTISTSDEIQNDADVDSAEESLDDTLPIEDVDDLVAGCNFNIARHANKNSYQSIDMFSNRAISALVGESPPFPKDSREFHPVHCSSAIHLDSAGLSEDSTSFEFSPQYCSSKMELKPCLSNRDVQQNPFAKHPAPIIREIAKLNPYLTSPCTVRMASEEFKPEKCSTALSESEFKIPRCPTGKRESSMFFAPLRCSTGLTRSASLNHPLPSVQAEFTPHRCSTGVQDNSTAFTPLRCSTENNESAVFNPILSSTATKNDDSNIPEFKHLRMRSEKY